MGIWREHLLPRVIDIALRGDDISEWRKRCVAGLAGEVVEPGFGSGLNLPHLPPEVTLIHAVDPAMLGRKLARRRIERSQVEVRFVGLDGQRLPLDDASCDAGLLTFTLCTIPDHRAALAELRRVIRPGGGLHFLEHGEAPDARVRRWQDRLTPVQRRLADGCHLNRPIPTLITDAGFTIEWLDAGYAGRPKFGSYFYVGRAVNPEPAGTPSSEAAASARVGATDS